MNDCDGSGIKTWESGTGAGIKYNYTITNINKILLIYNFNIIIFHLPLI